MSPEESLDILGVDRDSTWEEVRSSYLRKVSEWEQARAAANNDEERLAASYAFDKLNQAYEILQVEYFTEGRLQDEPETNNDETTISDAELENLGSVLDSKTIFRVMLAGIVLGLFFIAAIGISKVAYKKLYLPVSTFVANVRDIQALNGNDEGEADSFEVLEKSITKSYGDGKHDVSGSVNNTQTTAKYVSVEKTTLADINTSKGNKTNFVAKIGESDFNPRPEIIQASVRCDLPVVEKILKAGGNVDEEDSRGDTSLAWATKRGCTKLVSYLLKHGADVNHKANNGFDALMWARLYKVSAIEELLKKAGAKYKGSYWSRNDPGNELVWQKKQFSAFCKTGNCKSTNSPSHK